MDKTRLLDLLESVRRGDVDVLDAAARLASLDPRPLAHGPAGGPAVATLDHHRALRCGFPEVVYAPGKAPDDLARIAVEILARSERLLVTRVEGGAAAPGPTTRAPGEATRRGPFGAAPAAGVPPGAPTG